VLTTILSLLKVGYAEVIITESSFGF